MALAEAHRRAPPGWVTNADFGEMVTGPYPGKFHKVSVGST